MNKIYWVIFFSPLVVRAIQVMRENGETSLKKKQNDEKVLVILVFGIIIFFAGYRSFVADTITYVQTYEYLPSDIKDFDFSHFDRDVVFYFLSCCFKSITKASYQAWLFVIAMISGVAFGKGVCKYSKYKWLTCYLFIAGAMFTYFFNGARQFIVMSILFCNTDYILERKYIKAIMLIAVLSLIHGSAWFFLPTFFLEKIKPWSQKMVGIIVVSIAIALLFDKFAGLLDILLKNTQYAGMGKALVDGAGSTYIRVIIATIPVILSFLVKGLIEQKNDNALNFYVNCSVVYMCLMLISTFSFGIYVGRVAVYYEMYNLILLPILLYEYLEKKTSIIVIVLCMIMYFVYFYYQMIITWHLPYASEVLGIS